MDAARPCSVTLQKRGVLLGIVSWLSLAVVELSEAAIRVLAASRWIHQEGGMEGGHSNLCLCSFLHWLALSGGCDSIANLANPSRILRIRREYPRILRESIRESFANLCES